MCSGLSRVLATSSGRRPAKLHSSESRKQPGTPFRHHVPEREAWARAKQCPLDELVAKNPLDLTREFQIQREPSGARAQIASAGSGGPNADGRCRPGRSINVNGSYSSATGDAQTNAE